jgi:hypothetical protein
MTADGAPLRPGEDGRTHGRALAGGTDGEPMG